MLSIRNVRSQYEDWLQAFEETVKKRSCNLVWWLALHNFLYWFKPCSRPLMQCAARSSALLATQTSTSETWVAKVLNSLKTLSQAARLLLAVARHQRVGIEALSHRLSSRFQSSANCSLSSWKWRSQNGIPSARESSNQPYRFRFCGLRKEWRKLCNLRGKGRQRYWLCYSWGQEEVRSKENWFMGSQYGGFSRSHVCITSSSISQLACARHPISKPPISKDDVIQVVRNVAEHNTRAVPGFILSLLLYIV